MARVRAALETFRLRRMLEAQRRDHIAMLVHDLRHPLSSLGLIAEVLDSEDMSPRRAPRGRRADPGHVHRDGAPGRRRPRREPPRGGGLLGRAARRSRWARSSSPMLAVFTPVATRRRVALVFDGSLDLEVRADPQKLRQALDNLVANALKFTPRGGRVVVRVRAARAEGVRLRDLRHGPRDRRRASATSIFDRYKQGSRGRAAGRRGARPRHRPGHRRGAPGDHRGERPATPAGRLPHRAAAVRARNGLPGGP